MTLTHLGAALIVAALYIWLLPARWRGWALMAVSIVAVYWLSPALTIRYLDFALPTATVVLAAAIWWFTLPPDSTPTREDRAALGVLAVLILGLAATRYLTPELRPTPSRAPEVPAVALALAIAGAVIGLVGYRLRGRGRFLTVAIALIVGLFAVLKTEPLAIAAAGGLRALSGQQVDLARPGDLSWLGFSYVAFRLIHLLRDRQTGRLPVLSLREALTYVTFFPALTAGPIDRAERFVKDLRAVPTLTGPDAARIVEAAGRILIGILKKFVIADNLVLLALGPANAEQFTSAGGGWLLLYGYGLRLFLDFSGYTDIAIGLGLLFGLRLPENFDRPYTRQNITAFWQSWHISLSNWVRFYVFSPFSRALLNREPRPSPQFVVFAAQMVTMLIIGLWHGVTWAFVAWGAWHGLGLFAHKWWSDRTRRWYLSLKDRPRLKAAWTVAGWALTLQFVMLGWVWFALPQVDQAARVFLKLFGIGW